VSNQTSDRVAHAECDTRRGLRPLEELLLRPSSRINIDSKDFGKAHLSRQTTSTLFYRLDQPSLPPKPKQSFRKTDAHISCTLWVGSTRPVYRPTAHGIGDSTLEPLCPIYRWKRRPTRVGYVRGSFIDSLLFGFGPL